MHHDDKGHNTLKHYASLKGLNIQSKVHAVQVVWLGNCEDRRGFRLKSGDVSVRNPAMSMPSFSSSTVSDLH